MTAPSTSAHCRGDAGQVGGIEVIPLGVLTFVIGMLIAVNAWGLVDADLASTSAAREAVRASVESPDPFTARLAAVSAAERSLRGHGRGFDASQVRITHENGRPWARCTRVTVTVVHPMPALRLPMVRLRGRAFDVIARQSEVIDPYRSGLPGEANCG